MDGAKASRDEGPGIMCWRYPGRITPFDLSVHGAGNFTAPSSPYAVSIALLKVKLIAMNYVSLARTLFTCISDPRIVVLHPSDQFLLCPMHKPVPAPSQDDTAGKSSYSIHPPPPHLVIPPLDLVHRVSKFLFLFGRSMSRAPACRQAGIREARFDFLAPPARFAFAYDRMGSASIIIVMSSIL